MDTIQELTGSFVFQCSICGQRFEAQRDQKLHNANVHQSIVLLNGGKSKVTKNPDGNWHCPFPGCFKTLATPGELHSHNRVHAVTSESIESGEFGSLEICRTVHGWQCLMCTAGGGSYGGCTLTVLRRHLTKSHGCKPPLAQYLQKCMLRQGRNPSNGRPLYHAVPAAYHQDHHSPVVVANRTVAEVAQSFAYPASDAGSAPSMDLLAIDSLSWFEQTCVAAALQLVSADDVTATVADPHWYKLGESLLMFLRGFCGPATYILRKTWLPKALGALGDVSDDTCTRYGVVVGRFLKFLHSRCNIRMPAGDGGWCLDEPKSSMKSSQGTIIVGELFKVISCPLPDLTKYGATYTARFLGACYRAGHVNLGPQNPHFLRASEVKVLIAATKHLFIGCITAHYVSHVEDGQFQNSHMITSASTDNIARSKNSMLMVEELGQLFRDTRFQFCHLQQAMRDAALAEKSEVQHLKLQFIDRQQSIVRIDGCSVSFGLLGVAARKALQSAREVLRDCMGGYQLSESDWSLLGALMDNSISTDLLAGGFVDCLSDKAKLIPMELLEVRGRYWAHLTCTVSPVPAKFLAACVQLQQLIAFLIYLSGPPVRIPLLAGLRFASEGCRSSQTGNIHVEKGTLYLQLRSRKSESTVHKANVSGLFLPREVSMVLIAYAMLVRPLERTVAVKCSDSILIPVAQTETDSSFAHRVSAVYTSRLFVRSGAPMSPDYLRVSLRSAFLKYFEEPLTIQSYRQASIAIGDVGVKCQLISESVESSFASISGHSAKTARERYGRVDQGQSIGERHLQALICDRWHLQLGFRSFLDSEQCDRKESIPDPFKLIMKASDATAVNDGSVAVDQDNAARQRIDRSLFGAIIADGYEANWPGPLSACVKAAMRKHAIHLGDLKLVRQILLQLVQHDHFNSAEQSEGCALALLQPFEPTCRHMVVSFPTGAGKSLLYALPVMLEQTRKSILMTVLVCPLSAMKLDAERRLRAAGITLWVQGGLQEVQSGTTLDSVIPRPAMVLVSPEQIDASFLQSVRQTGRNVARVVYDEAHTSFTAQDYRPCLDRLDPLLSCGLPVLVMSATIPPALGRAMCARWTLSPNVTHHLRAGLCVPLHLAFQVRHYGSEGDAMQRMLPLLTSFFCDARAKGQHTARVICFCLSRQVTLDLVPMSSALEFTCGISIQTVAFNSGLSDVERRQAFETFRRSNFSVIFCTTSFGAGVDVPNVGLVIHLGGSRSVIDFVQECGRGGRDGSLTPSVVLDWPGATNLRGLSEMSRMSLQPHVSGPLTTNSSTSPDEWTCDISFEEYLHGAVRGSSDRPCRRRVLSLALTAIGVSCLDIGANVAMCDLCSSSENHEVVVTSDHKENSFQPSASDQQFSAVANDHPDPSPSLMHPRNHISSVPETISTVRLQSESAQSKMLHSEDPLLSLILGLESERLELDMVLQWVRGARLVTPGKICDGAINVCAVCWLLRSYPQHGCDLGFAFNSPGRCSLWGKCFRCFEGTHYAIECPLRSVQLDATIVCYGCALPDANTGGHVALDGRRVPPGTSDCVSYGRGNILPVCWGLWKTPTACAKADFPARHLGHVDALFYRWLFQVPKGSCIPNAVLLFMWSVRRYFQIEP